MKQTVQTLQVLLTFVILGLLAFPFLWVILTSIRPEQGMYTDTFQLLPEVFTFDNYRRLITSGFLTYIRNSVLVSLVSTVITVLMAILAAYAFSRYRFRGRRELAGTFAFTQLFPFAVLLMPLYIMYFRVGLVNSYVGLIIAYVAITLPFCVYMLIGYFQTVSISLDEAARIDGCSTLGIIFRVVLPVAWPGIVATAVYAFVRSWEEYLFALTLMTDDAKKTVPVGLANFFGQYTTEWGSIMTASVIATVPTMVFFLIMQKQLVSGLAAGAVKQ
jgi:ABC-type glycerol-3-phosphate transport system permease component